MSRLNAVLIAVLALEVGGGAALAYRRCDYPAAPLADLSYVDPLTGRQLRDMARNCRTADEWSKLGQAYMAYGYFAEAEACCRQAAALAPERPDLAYDWAFALERLGRYPEAVQEYQRAIQVGNAKPGDCWYYIGRVWLRLENADEARAAFLKAGEQPSARYEIARLLVREGKYDEAVAILDKLSNEHPKAVQPYLQRYRIEALRDGPLALVYADKAALAKDVLPSPWNDDYARFEDLHNSLGAAGEWAACRELIGQGKISQAEPRLRRALELEWDPAGADLMAKVEMAR